MRKIYKFRIDPSNPDGITVLDLPPGAVFLSAQLQVGQLTMWFELTPSRPFSWHVEIICRPTGYAYDPRERGEYLATVLQADGALVWHLFLRET